MKLILCLLLSSFGQLITPIHNEQLSSSKEQAPHFSRYSDPVQLSLTLREFMRDVAAGKLNDTEIGDKYFCTQLLHNSDAKGAKAREILAFWITDLRQELEKQHVNLNEITFSLYSDLPEETMELAGGSQGAYVARYKGASFRYFRLKDDKITSLTLISQGDRGFFFPICK